MDLSNFKKYSKHRSLDDYIRIGKQGIISLSKGFVLKNNLTDKHYVWLYFSRIDNAIGLRFIHSKRPGTLKSSVNKDPFKKSISANNFFKTHGIMWRDHVKNYSYKKLDDMFIVKLENNEVE